MSEYAVHLLLYFHVIFSPEVMLANSFGPSTAVSFNFFFPYSVLVFLLDVVYVTSPLPSKVKSGKNNNETFILITKQKWKSIVLYRSKKKEVNCVVESTLSVDIVTGKRVEIIGRMEACSMHRQAMQQYINNTSLQRRNIYPDSWSWSWKGEQDLRLLGTICLQSLPTTCYYFTMACSIATLTVGITIWGIRSRIKSETYMTNEITINSNN